jgi:hypothetical protein
MAIKPCSDEIDELTPILFQTCSNLRFLQSSSTKKFMKALLNALSGHFRMLLKHIIAKFHAGADDALAEAFAKIVIGAWIEADGIGRSAIQSGILRAMVTCGTLCGDANAVKGARIFLNVFNNARIKTPSLADTVNGLYDADFFQLLGSTNCVVRLNALTLFGTAFPIESPEASPDEKERRQNEQYGAMLRLLWDGQPAIRIEAAKVMGEMLSGWWEHGQRLSATLSLCKRDGVIKASGDGDWTEELRKWDWRETLQDYSNDVDLAELPKFSDIPHLGYASEQFLNHREMEALEQLEDGQEIPQNFVYGETREKRTHKKEVMDSWMNDNRWTKAGITGGPNRGWSELMLNETCNLQALFFSARRSNEVVRTLLSACSNLGIESLS